MENGKKNKKIKEWGRDIIDKTGNALSDQLTKGAVDIVDELAPEIFAKVKRSIKNKIWPQDSNSSSLNTNTASFSDNNGSNIDGFADRLMEDLVRKIIVYIYGAGVSVGRRDIWESMIQAMTESGMERDEIEKIFTISDKYERTPEELIDELKEKMVEIKEII